MGYLLPIAAASSSIEYGQIADMLARDMNIDGRIFPTKIGFVVGTLMHRLLKFDDTLPLINVLVVNKQSRTPSNGADSFLKGRFGVRSITPARRKELVASAAQKVYAYPEWGNVFRGIFKVAPPRLLGANSALNW